MRSGFITRFLLLICLAWTIQARTFLVSKPKVQDLPNWQLDADLKSSLEMGSQFPSREIQYRPNPSRSSYFKSLIEALGGQEPINPMEHRMDYGYGKGYLHKFKISK